MRKERGFSQAELAERIGIIQALVSDYETGKLAAWRETSAAFARALDVTADDLLQPRKGKRRALPPSRKVLRRLELIESLPTHQQQTVLKTIDTMLRGLRSAS